MERFDELERDRKIGDILVEMKPDLILMDQLILLPSVIRANVPYAFIVSANPVVLNLSDDYPIIGSDSRMDDKESIMKFRTELKPYADKLKLSSRENFDLMGVKIDEDVVTHRPVSKHFSVYCFPKEIDYYTDDVKKENKLISFDTPLIPERIPPKFVLPDEFSKQSGKILYVSLGSMFSMYTGLVQRLVDILETMPQYRYIVSKGPKGDQIKFPENGRFIGENYVNQLAVLQVVDGMIGHGINYITCFFIQIYYNQFYFSFK